MIKKLNLKKFMDSASLAIALTIIALSIGGYEAKLVLGLSAFIGLTAVVLFFGDVSSSARWKSFTKWVDEFDFAYIAFGLGLLTSSNDITDNYWGIIMFLLAGVIFTAFGLGRMIGIRTAELSTESPKKAIIVGVITLIAGVIWMAVKWSEIAMNPLRGGDGLCVYYLLCVGISFLLVGIIQHRRKKKAERLSNKDQIWQ